MSTADSRLFRQLASVAETLKTNIIDRSNSFLTDANARISNFEAFMCLFKCCIANSIVFVPGYFEALGFFYGPLSILLTFLLLIYCSNILVECVSYLRKTSEEFDTLISKKTIIKDENRILSPSSTNSAKTNMIFTDTSIKESSAIKTSDTSVGVTIATT